MLKYPLAAGLIATTFAATLASAQTSPSPSPPANPPPATTSPATPGMSSSVGGQFVAEQSMSQWRASKLVGVDVYGTDNQKIGDINEVLLNKEGMAEAVVIGVGGFLGIGEKNVVVPFKALE